MKSRTFLFYLLLTVVYSLFIAQLVNLQILQGKKNLALSAGNRIKIEKIRAVRGLFYDREKRALVYNLEVKNKAGLSREYLYGPVLAHLLGYVDKDYIARSGLEKEYDELLKGKDGGDLIEVDSQGKKIRQIGHQEPVPGENLYLTVDLDLQKKAWEALGHQKGAVVVSRPDNGEILALVSKPSFNPNCFINQSDLDDEVRIKLKATLAKCPAIEEILNSPDRPFFNRAIHGVYPPGSIFKIVTAAAGLESGKINKNTRILDTGEIRVGKYRYGNWYYDRYGKTEGLLNVVDALKRSNDIFFYRVGEKVGAKKLVEWAKAFGLGQKEGFLPDPENRRWFLGNTYHLSIGQGKIGVTPLQVNLMTNVIANGGKLCQSKLVKDSKTECQDLGLQRETIEIIKEGMKQACGPQGTSHRFLDFPFQVACKTGTAEFGDSAGRTHAWFTIFAPLENPQITVTVLVEAGGEGSTVAAPVAKEILQAWAQKEGLF